MVAPLDEELLSEQHLAQEFGLLFQDTHQEMVDIKTVVVTIIVINVITVSRVI